MNIVDLLIEDHDRMRQELAGIRSCDSESDMRSKLKEFISKYELHESIEDEILFPAMSSKPKKAPAQMAAQYEKSHEKIWGSLDQLVNRLGHASFDELRDAYLQFYASIDAHMGNEERELFPMILNKLEPKILENLGRTAEQRLSRFQAIG